MIKKDKIMRGGSIIDALLWLGIAAVIVISIIGTYNNASNSTKLQNAKSQITSIGAGVQALYASQSTYDRLSTALVVNAGIAPSNAVNGDELVNPWGGDTTVEGFVNYFEVAMEDVPSDACVNLLSAGMISEGSIIRISSGNRHFSADANPADAIDACNALNVVTFRFR